MISKGMKLINQKLSNNKITVFDVGAKGGVYSFPKLIKHTNSYGFEPNPKEYNSLISNKNSSITYFPFALGEKKEIRDFNITKHASYSSFLKFDNINFEKHFGFMKDYHIWKKGMKTEKTISVETQNIDNILAQEKIKTIDFLKLDTQGTELEILKGAKQALKNNKIGVIFTEFSFIQSYLNQNLFSELEIYLRNLGYELIDCKFYPEEILNSPFNTKILDKTRYSVGGDAIFVPRLENTNLEEITIFKIGLIIASLEYYSIANSFFKHIKLSDTDIQSIFKYLKTSKIKQIGRSFIPPVLYKIIKTFLR